MYNVILFSDVPFAFYFSRNYGMHRLATELRQQGYTVLCVNYISSLGYDQFKELVDLSIGESTVAVGFSTTWMEYRIPSIKNNQRSIVSGKIFSSEFNTTDHPWYYNSMGHLFPENPEPWINYIKSKNKNIKIIAGGPKAAFYSDIKSIDNIFIGAGETQLLDYINSLTRKGPRRIFNRIINYDRNAQNSGWNFQESLTSYIEEDLLHPHEFINIEFSRGCMFNCSFCSYPLVNQTSARDIIKYKETIRDELLNNYLEWGVTKYLIIDHTFNDSTLKLQTIKEVVDSLPFKPKFWANVRIDLFAIHPEQAQLLLDIGIKEVLFGLETINARTGKLINKAHRKNSLKGLQIAKDVWGDEVYIQASMIGGLPEENTQSIEDTITWFVAEGNKLIDHLGYGPLTFITSAADESVVDVAGLDKDLSKFGYKMAPTADDQLNWVKIDSSDITSRSQVIELIGKYRGILEQASKPDKFLFWLSGYEIVNPDYAWDNLKDAPHLKSISATSGSPQEMYRKYCETIYWPKLLDLIRSKY